MVAASGFEPDPRPPEPSADPGPRIASSGRDVAQVGPSQKVAGAAARKGRTEGVLRASSPALRASTAGAQQEHDGEDGPAGVDSESPDGSSAGTIATVAPGESPLADHRAVVEVWPSLPEPVRAAILAIVRTVVAPMPALDEKPRLA